MLLALALMLPPRTVKVPVLIKLSDVCTTTLPLFPTVETPVSYKMLPLVPTAS